ncbi:ribonuclease T2 family protein [Saprolegnia diclina VS20]|uniref:Ribonuclease T2 family protein n=1 Tax=Saprolegnia diclina (strain VS20) TaxID=1156394 RepID=T0QLT0_SAPDV|nr:ribonuclease T2 family protein [Saprolegnia diclina VS20]EQC38994.1 ribonuclease T2 family protein [Saprolegnia diclina VS20]|eukprot:XP_008607818.1 ribonuclease T2 family protein [Saprolegnia diclina VS20]
MKATLILAASIHAAAAFDFYLLAQTWQPAFCSTGNFPGCDQPTDFMTNHLTIHGLWPENTDGSYPSNCDPSSALSQDTIDAIGMDAINQYWPDVKTNYGTDFISNEWAKHGTCSGLGQLDYVQAVIATEKKIGTSTMISGNAGKSVAASAIRTAYGQNMVSLVCKNSVLSEVRTCWSVNTKTGGVGSQIACPSAILNQDTCSRKNGKVITIPSF